MRRHAILGTLALTACSSGTSSTTDGGSDAAGASTGPHYATYVKVLGDHERLGDAIDRVSTT